MPVKKNENVETLAEAFKALKPEQKKRLAEHRRRKTPICCGHRSCEFISTNGDGGG